MAPDAATGLARPPLDPDLVERARPVSFARERVVPVLEPLRTLLPLGGLQRGQSVEVGGVGATSLALALLAGGSQEGSWVATVGLPSLGLAAAEEAGVVLERLVLVARPDPGSWGTVVASLADAFDLILLAPGRERPADARRLEARTRRQGTVLVRLADSTGRTRSPTPADLTLRVTDARWEGLGDGHGRLLGRRVEVEARGRRNGPPRRASLWLPGASGAVEQAATDPPRRLRAVHSPDAGVAS